MSRDRRVLPSVHLHVASVVAMTERRLLLGRQYLLSELNEPICGWTFFDRVLNTAKQIKASIPRTCQQQE